MPSRIIRNNLLDSETVSRAGELPEVLFVRLLLVADDYGRFDGRVSVICRACWPIGKKTDPQPDEVQARLDKLAQVGLVVLYEFEGKPFIHIPKFKQRTRAMKSKFPDPPVIRTSHVSQVTDNRMTDDGAPHDSRARSRSRISESDSNFAFRDSDSNAERAREQEKPIPPAESPAPTSRQDRATPPTGESPSEFFRRHTGAKPPRKPFEDDEAPMREGTGT